MVPLERTEGTLSSATQRPLDRPWGHGRTLSLNNTSIPFSLPQGSFWWALHKNKTHFLVYSKMNKHDCSTPNASELGLWTQTQVRSSSDYPPSQLLWSILDWPGHWAGGQVCWGSGGGRGEHIVFWQEENKVSGILLEMGRQPGPTIFFLAQITSNKKKEPEYIKENIILEWFWP